MIFLGRSFLGSRNTIDATATSIPNISQLTIYKGVFDNLFITKDTSRPFDFNTVYDWDYDTVMNAAFNGTLNAGNVDYTVKQVSAMRIKRRKTGTYSWVTLFEIPISSVEDFKFERFDRTASSNNEYDYALVPLMSNVEGNLNINTIKSSFNGIFIVEKDQAFHTILDTGIQVSKKNLSAIVNTIGNKYPYVVRNNKSNYSEGSAFGTFIELDTKTCLWKTESGNAYRQKLIEFLCNGKPKILKYFDGRAWLVSIVGDISEAENEHPDRVTTTFQWVEIGDVDNSKDLYNSGFSDISFGSW